MVPKIDKHGNLLYNQTGLLFVEGQESLLQTLANRLRLSKGESYYHHTDGMNYHDIILTNDIPLIKREITYELKKDKRVLYTDIQSSTDHNYQLRLNIRVKAGHEQLI